VFLANSVDVPCLPHRREVTGLRVHAGRAARIRTHRHRAAGRV